MNSPPAGKPQRAEGFTVGSRPCAFLKPSVRLARRKDFSERILGQKIGNDLRCRLLLRLSDGDYWRSLGDSNPCFRRERATSWAARRREQSGEGLQIAPITAARKQVAREDPAGP